MSTPRPAQIVAETLNVLCPYCGEPHGNPDNGADNWKPEEVAKAQGRKVECNSCEEVFVIHHQQRVGVL